MHGEDQDRVGANYRQNYDGLVEVKRRYDPDNLFRLNQNITPSWPAEAEPTFAPAQPRWWPRPPRNPPALIGLLARIRG